MAVVEKGIFYSTFVTLFKTVLNRAPGPRLLHASPSAGPVARALVPRAPWSPMAVH